jgi:putative ABC transport system permease protein
MLGRKRRRDLWQLRGQVIAIVLVAAVGVANLVMSRAALASLQGSRERYYREQAFADAFADLKRAPEQVAAQLAEIPGVVAVDTRIVAYGRIELAGFGEPIQLQALSLPETQGPRLNGLHLRDGHRPGEGDRLALVLSDAFAEAQRLHAGDTLTVVMHGRRQDFRIAGIGATPEFVAQMAPQSVFPDPKRFAVAWMPRPTLEAAVDLDGAFNSVVFALSPGAARRPVLDAIDRVLARYGAIGAIAREDQRSHRYLSEEFRQLRTMARLFPAVFLSVSSFVLYVVLGRLVAGQREQIGTLKAFGYRPAEMLRHYLGFALLIGTAGALLGVALGLALGRQIASLYGDFYRLPYLDFGVPAAVVWLAFAVSIGSAVVGAAVPVLRATRLPPADAMRADVPWRRRWLRLDRFAPMQRLDQAHRLIAHNLLQRPLRTLLTWMGLALGTAIVMMGRFQSDAIDDMVNRQFQRGQRHDLSIAMVEPASPRALAELRTLPGVTRVEPQRAMPVRVRYRAASHRTAVVGVVPGAQLRHPLDRSGRPITPPPGGLLLTDYLADMLGARPGSPIELETLLGRRRVLRMPLSRVVDEPFGVQAYLPLETLDRELGDGERLDGAVLAVDSAATAPLYAALERRPAVAAIDQRRVAIRNFYDSMAETILTFTLITTAFGVVITTGVVYSSARVALSERSRDLASLRVLGFTTGEVGYLLLGELALLTALAVPLGFALGQALVALLVRGFDSDLFRIPHYVSPATYGIAGLCSLVAALLTGGVIGRRVRGLDLVGVLKARD